MCLACEMENELWFAYLDQLAEQEKAQGTEPATPPGKAEAAATFICEEPPSE
jgi:hypothetical protein